MKFLNFSRQEARKIVLASQCLRRPAVGKQSPKRLTRETISQIGYLQLDTISVLERAHHHVLFSRLPTYRPELLAKLEQEGSIFEYWSHAASYLPMTDYRFTLPQKQEIQSQEKFWYAKDRKVMQHVLDRITNEGPLMSKDFEKPEGYRITQMWQAAPTKRALHNLFMEGKIMVRSRQGFQKVYDLTERVIPDGLDISTPSRAEYIEFLIRRDSNAHGIMSTREMGYLLKGCQQEIRETTQKLVELGVVRPCKIAGLDGTYFAGDQVESLLAGRYSQEVKILSPFDNVLINRGRTSELFGFDYVLECYVPAPKRRFGYFGLPILWRNNLIGQVDLKAYRAEDVLEVRNLAINLRHVTEEFIEAWKKSLTQFMAFQGVHQLRVNGEGHSLDPSLAASLCKLP